MIYADIFSEANPSNRDPDKHLPKESKVDNQQKVTVPRAETVVRQEGQVAEEVPVVMIAAAKTRMGFGRKGKVLPELQLAQIILLNRNQRRWQASKRSALV